MESKKEAKVETNVVPKNDKKSQGTLHPNYKSDVEFRAKWREDEDFRKSVSSRFNWSDDEARGIIVRESGWVKEKPNYKVCCCGNDFADICFILGSLLALYIAYALFFAAMFFFWQAAQDFALYLFLVLMAVYWLVVGVMVQSGAARIEKEKQAEDEREEKRLKAE